MYRPFRLGDSHPLYTYPPVTDFPTWWLYANMGRMSSVVAEKNTQDLTKISSGGKTFVFLPKPTGGKVSENSPEEKKLTQWGVVAQFEVVTLKTLLRSPPIVPSVHDNVNFFISVLTNISAEYTTFAVAAYRVTAIHGAPPHVSDPIGKDLWSCVWVSEKGIVRRDPVHFPPGVISIHVNAEDFPQQSTPG